MQACRFLVQLTQEVDQLRRRQTRQTVSCVRGAARLTQKMHRRCDEDKTANAFRPLALEKFYTARAR